MVAAEHASMTLLHTRMPTLSSEPIAWGTYASSPTTHFFLCRYISVSPLLPPPPVLIPHLEELHENSSPDGDFGSPHTAYGGRNPQLFLRSKSWEESFSQGLDAMFDTEETAQGADLEMRKLRERLMTKVIPRLLRPLQTEGRVLVPALVHGDLWDGNVGTEEETGRTVIFDAVALYAHNECKSLPDLRGV